MTSASPILTIRTSFSAAIVPFLSYPEHPQLSLRFLCLQQRTNQGIQLRTLNGKVVYRTDNTNGQKFSLLTHQLASGSYLMEIQT